MADIHNQRRDCEQDPGHWIAPYFNGYELRRPGKNRGAHQPDFKRYEPLARRQGSPQQADGRGGNQYGQDIKQPLPELTRR